ncbi:26S proteasome non-ATPase regulatory subunit 13 [Triticum urartu]|uniref:26S proteasome non-ATPase regulatory subunit 13 n=1 Tax=Triticum urartu TaxID=4572 RepID=M7YL66_TRIUA|nr:26S proteasome non-ATPase regulatory subunit 13 [Triticum urartu]
MRSEETIHSELGAGDDILSELIGDDEEDGGRGKKPRAGRAGVAFLRLPSLLYLLTLLTTKPKSVAVDVALAHLHAIVLDHFHLPSILPRTVTPPLGLLGTFYVYVTTPTMASGVTDAGYQAMTHLRLPPMLVVSSQSALAIVSSNSDIHKGWVRVAISLEHRGGVRVRPHRDRNRSSPCCSSSPSSWPGRKEGKGSGGDQAMAAPLEFLEAQGSTRPELAEWYAALADLYQRKLWHQLTLKLDQFLALAVVQAGDALIQLYTHFISDFESKINLLKFAHFAVVVSRQYSDKDAGISYLEGVISKLRDTKESRVEEPILNMSQMYMYHIFCSESFIMIPETLKYLHYIWLLFRDIACHVTGLITTVWSFPFVQAGDALIQLYTHFISDFESKINLLKFAHFAVVVSRQYSDKDAGISYLEGVISKLRDTKESRVEEPILYVKMQIASFLLEKGNQKECKKLVDEGKTTLDSMDDVDPSVHSTYYWLCSQYHKVCQDYSEFYKNALLYLAYTTVESLSEPFKQNLAFDLSLAALLGDNIYNFGELLAHPIIHSLVGTSVEWIYHILQAFNSGNLASYQELCKVHAAALSAQPALVQKERELLEKINILCLMEIIFSRASQDRTIPLSTIAEQTRLSVEDVEYLLMKSLSAHLIEGIIDGVDGTVHVSWAQPRVLGIDQVKSLRDRLDTWVGKVHTTLLSVEAETPDLITGGPLYPHRCCPVLQTVKVAATRCRLGSCNDINVLQRSPLFKRLCDGEAPSCNYTVNGHKYNMWYYLVDAIYPQWLAFVKTISDPHGNKQSHFATCQEAIRKDMERAFEVLQARCGIVREVAITWKTKTFDSS